MLTPVWAFMREDCSLMRVSFDLRSQKCTRELFILHRLQIYLFFPPSECINPFFNLFMSCVLGDKHLNVLFSHVGE